MVEAIPVLTVMILFLGMTMYVFRGYKEKIVQEQKTRSEALTEASHACDGSGGGSGGDGTSTGAALGDSAAGVSERVSGGKVSGTMMMKTVTKTGSATVSGTVVEDLKKKRLSRTVTAWSQTMCRPKSESSDFLGGGGLGSLQGKVGL
jgi:hypothetical protein